MKNLRIISFFLVLVLSVCSLQLQAKRVVKVLAIGNSFSVDAVEQYLYELAAAQGDSLVIGNAYIGGCSLDHHWENAKTLKPEYSYRKIVGGVRKIMEESEDMGDMLKDEPWDIITLQQLSSLSGQYETYSNLGNLMDDVKSMATNSHFKFAFHMTWAYASNSTHSGFINYGKSQFTMYNEIKDAVKKAMKDYHIKLVIPSGIAIQNARSEVGDTLCRDGYHLSYSLGRYIVACTWCEFLTGKSVVGNSYRPSGITAEQALIAQNAAHNAMKEVKHW